MEEYFLEETQVPLDEKLDFIKKNFLNNEITSHFLKQVLTFSNLLFISKKFEDLQHLLDSLDWNQLNTFWLNFKEIQIENCEALGDLENLYENLLAVLEAYVIKKANSKGLLLLEKKARLLRPVEYYTFKFVFLVQAGDFKKIDESEEFNFIHERYLAGISLGGSNLDEMIENINLYEANNLLSIKTPLVLFSIRLKFLLEKIKLKMKIGEDCLAEREVFINAIYKRLVISYQKPVLYLLLIDYGLILRRKKLLLNLKAVTLTHGETFKESIFFFNLINSKLKKITKIKDNSLDEAEIDKQLEDLLLGSTSKVVSKMNVKGKEAWFHVKESKFDSWRVSKALLKSCEYVDEDDFKNYFIDIISCFVFLDCNDAALELIQKFTSKYEIGPELEIELAYLKAEINLRRNDLQGTLEVIYEALEDFPLNEDETINFKFLEAKVNFLLGLKPVANRIFKEIAKKRPHYRGIKWRVKESESTK